MDCDTGISHLHGNIVRGMVYTTDTVASCCTGWPGLSLLMNTSVMASPRDAGSQLVSLMSLVS